jgi:putative ABC transport system ATP-binding protein
MMNEEIVRLQDVKKVYKTGDVETYALNGISLSVNKGEFAALCGPSGSGKTTALNLIGALDTPSSGKIEVEGRNIAQMSKSDLSKMRMNRIGIVFQAYNLIPVLTAYENAEFVLVLQGIPDRERKDRVMAILEEVGMADLAHRRPSQLSGGQQQRVAIARAVVSEPALILADEPTANVDSKTAESLLVLMEHLNHDYNSTFIFSTHDPRVMERAHRLIMMKDGEIAEDKMVE